MINWGLRQALGGVPGSVSWQSVSGYALTGLTFKGLEARGPGYEAHIEQVRVGYNLLAVLGGKLPLSLELAGGKIALDPAKLQSAFAGGGGGGGGASVQPVLQRLALENVKIESAAWPQMVLPAYSFEINGSLPDFDWRLQTADGDLAGRLAFRSPADWRTTFAGDVAVSRFWWNGQQSGRLEGVFGYQKGHWLGKAQLTGGSVVLAGFPIAQVTGPITYRDHVITTELRGQSLEGPVSGSGTVDIPAAHYQFSARGTPRLRALMRLWNVNLPADGSGPFELRGGGDWEKLELSGSFSGKGAFLERPLEYDGGFSFDGRDFRLHTNAAGAFLDRKWNARFDLKNVSYTAQVRDDKGSEINLQGRNTSYSGSGRLVWPAPLEGAAQVAFAGDGTRWRLNVHSPDVRLLLARKPLDLSGSLAGDGLAVAGRLGPLALTGSWDDLKMTLDPVALTVGEVAGEGVWRGSFRFDGAYHSPYLNVPITVWQQGADWKGRLGSYGGFSWREGLFSARVDGLPLNLIGGLRLSGDAVWTAAAGWSGRQRLRGRYLSLTSELQGQKLLFKGLADTPLGTIPLSGMADSSGVHGLVDRARFSYASGRIRLNGELLLKDISYAGDVAWSPAGWSGAARLESPWLQAQLSGRGALYVRTSGYLRGEGRAWPDPDFNGELQLPAVAGVRAAALPVHVGRQRATVGDGYVELAAPFKFEVRLPLSYRSYNAVLAASGDMRRGSASLISEWGTLRARGPWNGLELTGALQLPRLGAAQISGAANLPGLEYDVTASLPQAAGAAGLKGKGTVYSWRFSLQDGAARVSGDSDGLTVALQGFDSSPYGLPGVWNGQLARRGALDGDLSYAGPYGDLRARGYGTLRLEGAGPGYQLRGYLNDKELNALLKVAAAPLAGQVEISGPWNDLRADGEGIWRVPGTAPQSWRLAATAADRHWALSGPLELTGAGADYSGRIAWDAPVYGRPLRLSGSFSGSGLELSGRVLAEINGVREEVAFSHQREWSLAASGELGNVEFRGSRLRVAALDLDALGRALAVPLEGRLAGALDLQKRSGSLSGAASAGGLSFGLAFKPLPSGWSLSAYSGRLGAGLRLLLGPEVYLEGLGAATGRMSFGAEWGGAISYGGEQPDGLAFAATLSKNHDASATVRFKDLEVLELDYDHLANVVSAAFDGEVKGGGWLDLGRQEYDLEARYGSRAAEAYLRLHGTGQVWRGGGFLVGYQGLPQAGPVSLQGNGARWSAVWAAPLTVRLSGEGAHIGELSLFGATRMGSVARDLGWLRSDLSYRTGKYAGELKASGPGWWVRLDGAGSRATAMGDLFGFDLSGSLDQGAGLDLALEGERSWGPSRLNVSARASGRLLEPVLQSSLLLTGSGGAKVEGRFDYDRERGWRLAASGPGLKLRAGAAGSELKAERFDLAPFTGVPLLLDAQGSGPTSTLALALRVYDAAGRTDLRGSFTLPEASLRLAGGFFGGRAEIAEEGGVWRLDLDHPLAKGEIVYHQGWSGGLDVDLPVGSGGLRGRLDAARASLKLSGYGGYQGGLELGLDPLRLDAELRGRSFALESNLRRLGGVWAGDLSLDLPGWGGVHVSGDGEELNIHGSAGLQPLRGELQSNPWSLSWSYDGPLPRGLGSLSAAGAFPGEWLRGEWRYGGLRWQLRGVGAELAASAPGAELKARAGGLEAKLEGLELAGLPVSGSAKGPWKKIHFDLSAAGLRLEGVWGEPAEVRVSGWLAGRLRRAAGVWSGELHAADARLVASGSGLLPRLQGEWQSRRLLVDIPVLAVDDLKLDLAKRSASGELDVGRLRLVGEGQVVTATFPLAGAMPAAILNLRSMKLRVDPDGAGSGSLSYAPGTGFSGELSLRTGLGEVQARGNGGLRVVWRHERSDWLPWREGRFVFTYGSGWSLEYEGGKAIQARLESNREGLNLWVKSDWGGGKLVYDRGWRGRISFAGLPLAPLEARLDGELVAEAGALAARGELAGNAGRLSYSLRGDAGGLLPRLGNAALVLENMRLEKLPRFLNKLPYAKGNVSGTFAYGGGMLAGRLVSDGLTVAGETYPLEAALYWSGERKTLALSLGDSRIEGEWQGNDLRLRGEMVRLPLHFLTGAWAGPLAGTGYWTGAAKAHLRLDDLRKSYAVLVGERLEFSGGGDSLSGRAAARYENGVFYLDELDLQGKGSWRGAGYWGPDDADLSVEIDNTVFTPVLSVFPQLRRLHPSAAGSLSLRAEGKKAELRVRDLDFSLASVSGVVSAAQLDLANGGVRLDGRLKFNKPYPGSLTLAGSGKRDDLTLNLSGDVDLPAVGRLEQVGGELHWPDWKLSLRAGDARLSGVLWPLSLKLTGELPVALPEKYLVSGLVRPDLTLVYQRGEYVLGGEAQVLRAVLSRPEGKREVAFKVKKYNYPLRFDRVRIYSDGGIIIQEPLAGGEGEGEVYLGGDVADPYLSGQLKAIRGYFLLGRHRFVVDEGWARFTPAGGLYPDIYLLAHANVPTDSGELQLYLETDGRFVREKGRARLVLEPRIWALENGQPAPYSQEELLALLALGGGSLVQGAADLAVQNLLVAQLEYELSKALGLDIFTLDTGIFSGNGSTQFTIGKYLSPDLLLTYSINLQGDQTVGAEYRIDGLRLRVESEINADSLEPLVRFSLLYAIRKNLDLTLKLQTGEMRFGLEWRF